MLYFSQCYAAASVVQVSLEPVQHQQAPLCVYMLMYPVRQHVRVFVRDNHQASVFCIFRTAWFPIRPIKRLLRHAISLNTNGTPVNVTHIGRIFH